MKVLVDSHVFLWILIAPEKLSAKAREVLKSPENTIFLSVVSLWEISLKHGLGKLDLHGICPEELPNAAETAGFEILTISSLEAATFGQLAKLGHKDPFDRMLVWQAIQGKLALVSRDSAMKNYLSQGLNLIW